MNNVLQAAEPAVAGLLAGGGSGDEDYLYTELGQRLSAMSLSTEGSDRFDMTVDATSEAFGPMDEMKNLGKKFFKRWNKAAHELCCGADPDDADARKKVQDAFGFGEQAVGATIAALLVAHFGLAAAIAGVVAVIIVRLFYIPGGEAMCEYWAEKL